MLQQNARTVLPRHGAFGAGPAPRAGRVGASPIVRASAGKQPSEEGDAELQLSRRQALAAQLVLVAGVLAPAAPARAEEAVEAKVEPGQMKQLTNGTLAYQFEYPTSTTSGRPLSMIMSRPPEKYSSAPPLTADARQRIVSEIFDFRNFVTASMSVGPAAGILKDRLPEEWKPKEVALSVLIDRSTARTTAGQRVALNDLTAAALEARDGQPYWVYEHVSQGSPTISIRTKESYRHALAVTGWRAGQDGSPFLYTLNLSCPEALWPELEPLFRRSVASFTLLPTGNDYIPPDKDPWLFF